MQIFKDAEEARNAIMDFRAEHMSEVPEDLHPLFRQHTARGGGVDIICHTADFIWANRERMGDNAKGLAASLFAFAMQYGWHETAVEDRGPRIVANLRKEIGEIKSAPAAPDARRGFRVEPPAADEPAPAEGE